MQNTKLSFKKIIHYTVMIFIIIVLIYDAIVTIKLNHRYTGAVSYNAELRRYCETNGDEYIMSGKCSMMRWYIAAAVQIFNVYYDEEHRKVSVTLEIREDKLGRREYKVGFDTDEEHKWGGYVYIDESGNPISKYGETIDERSVEKMQYLNEEVQRAVALANSKWNLGLSYNSITGADY